MANTTTLSFGIKTTQYFAYEDILRVWLEADTVPDIDHAWLFDHPMPILRSNPSGPCLDGWTLLAALAAQTTRLRLGLMVASNVNQTPPWLAKRAATVDIISRGRLEFGLGAGGVEREHEAYGTDLFPPAERIRRLGEACQIIKRLWTEPVVDFEGRYYHFKEAYCEPKPVQQPTPPFVIGAVGEQLSLRVAARHADIWNSSRLPTYQRRRVCAQKPHPRQLLRRNWARPRQSGALRPDHLRPGRAASSHPPDHPALHRRGRIPSGAGTARPAPGHCPLAERRDHPTAKSRECLNVTLLRR